MHTRTENPAAGTAARHSTPLLRITGYFHLDPDQAALADEIGVLRDRMAMLCSRIQGVTNAARARAKKQRDLAAEWRIDQAAPELWLAQGTAQLQQGMMSLERALTRPEHF
jgi:hypothetical protein